MDKKEISKKFGEAQAVLESMQDTGATCLFVGNEGNHFVLSGNPTKIVAQIIFAIMRYPVFRNIIKTCAARFDEMDNHYGDGARKVVMDYVIEKDNEGN